jgi:hypothetical protein
VGKGAKRLPRNDTPVARAFAHAFDLIRVGTARMPFSAWSLDPGRAFAHPTIPD